VAESVTAVPVGPEIEAPDWPLPLPQVVVPPEPLPPQLWCSVVEDWPHVELHPLPVADSDVVTVTGVGTGGVVPVTVSTSDPQVLVEAALVESPE
jgi:hypothetical protein